MEYWLTKENVNKITSIGESSVVVVPSDEFVQGSMLMLFNNSDNFICLRSMVENTYQSGSKLKRQTIEWPPRAILNIVFVEQNLVVIKVEI